jgi:glutamate--cysteine ligase
MHEPNVDESEWLFHLSTLFPEVRPKEYFELRSADTIEPHLLAAPIVFVTGLVYDQESAARATDSLVAPSEAMLERAGRLGLSDPEIHRIASSLTELALSGARRLGEDYVSPAYLLTAGEYFARALARDDT